MTVRLTRHDLEIITEVLQLVVDYKFKSLRKDTWNIFYNQYLTKIVDQISRNEFVVNHPTKNSLAWLKDQIQWSRRLIPGVKLCDCPPLSSITIGQEAIDICTRAQRGQHTYNLKKDTKFTDLFTNK